MAIFHNRKFFPSKTSAKNVSSSSSSSTSPAPCSYDFCDPSCSGLEDCHYFPDPRELLPPLPALPPPPPLPPPIEQVYQLSPMIIILIVLLAAIFFLVSFSAFVVKWFTGCTRFQSRRSPGLGQSQVDGIASQHESVNLFGEVDDQEPVVDHPIWLISTVGLQQSVINSITVVRYKRGDGLIEGTDCSVCLGEFQEGETLRLLPKCNHAFHIDCIDPWLRSHTNCPLCRAGIAENPDPSRPSVSPNEPGLGQSRWAEVSQIQDSDSSDVELGRNQVGDVGLMDDNRMNDEHYEVVDNDQNKTEGEISNNHSGNGIIEGSIIITRRRSYSGQFYPGSNSSPFRSVASSSSSWRRKEVTVGSGSGSGSGSGFGHGPSPSPIIKRSSSWSERVCGSRNNQSINSRFSP